MQCPPEIAAIIGEILVTGLVRIRALGWRDQSARCAVEADYLHNLPQMFVDFKPEMLDYYWRAERVAYIKQSSPEELSWFEPLWNALAEHVGDEKSAAVAVH